jgi:uncharacterized protein (DUF1501 family)
VVANVGLLAAPLNRTQWEAGSVEVPPQLFSHSDQANFWQAGVPSYSTANGWGGRIADVLASANAGGKVSAAITVAGANLWQVGNSVIPYPVYPDLGAAAVNDLNDGAYGTALRSLLAANRSNLLEQEAARVYARAVSGESAIGQVFANSTAIDAMFDRTPPASVPNPASQWHADLTSKLATVARLISARDTLGLKRQVFFVGIGGFDMHNSLAHHRYALQAISDGLTAFYNATVRMGVADQVMAFTASDFGRPLKTNGTGSDHGWGAHHLVVGGGIKGGNLYGSMPSMDLNGPSYAGAQGHLIPTTSVEQYAGAMARWMGVSDTDLRTVLPNIGRFGPTLGFA